MAQIHRCYVLFSMIQKTTCTTVVEEGFICANISQKDMVKLTSQGSRKGWSTFRKAAQNIAIIFSYSKWQDSKTWGCATKQILRDLILRETLFNNVRCCWMPWSLKMNLLHASTLCQQSFYFPHIIKRSNTFLFHSIYFLLKDSSCCVLQQTESAIRL